MKLVNRRALEGWGGPMNDQMYEAECGTCGSSVERSSNEFAPGAWAQYLVVRRLKGLVDLGANVDHGRVYRPRPLIALGPGMIGMQKATAAYPFLEEDAWLAWMREVR